MTYVTCCTNCGCEEFLFDPRNYQTVALHPDGGIYADPSIPASEDWSLDSPEQVTCMGCGLEVERERLDPNFDWNAELPAFKIKIHG